MTPLEKQLYWRGVILHFALFSFHSLATATLAALIGVKWDVLTAQEKFLIFVAIMSNWTGVILVFIQKSMSRIVQGKPPIETGDTTQLVKPT